MSRQRERREEKVAQRRAAAARQAARRAARRQRDRAVAPQSADRRPRRLDVVAFVLGLIFVSIAAAGLWRAAGGTIDWGLIKIVAPLGLVAVGVLGLALSRNRN